MAAEADSDLICPRCEIALPRVRSSYGVFWACQRCGGRAVGVELLRRTFTPASVNPIWLHAMQSPGRSACRCPSCGNAMTEVALADHSSVRVDVCKLCHFVWFDACEVESLTPRPLPDAPPERLPQKQREKLAIAKVREMALEAELRETGGTTAAWWKAIGDFLSMIIH